MPSGGVTPAGGGGGTQPGPYAYYSQSAASLAAAGRFTWAPINSPSYPGNLASAALLLDLTVPTTPAAVSAGVYAISVEAICNSAHAGKVMAVYVFFDVDGSDDGPGTYGIPLDSGFATASATGVRALTAGTKIECDVSHNIGGSATFDFWALVQRIT